ncbi:hypothetical protein [Marinicella sp. W31]|uniref:hypothetical protein n=1 Tax=Marinicella sp. W31 TaxID=3023713 RepID=UPI00375734E8
MKFRKKPLIQAICVLLPSITTAAEFEVTQCNDDGTGLVANTLSWSILQANTTPGNDTIVLSTDVLVSGVMKRLIDSDVTITSDQTRRTIDGNNLNRPLFIKSGTVTISNVKISNGRAKGGESGGAGMGGGIFIYDGNVNIQNVSITNSLAYGGNGFVSGGGGGMFGNGSLSAGGGLFTAANGSTGGYGGYGLYSDVNTTFGRGGSPGQHGGFGGGGSDAYSSPRNGGFGGAGGYCYCYESGFGGSGGFGASGGDSLYSPGSSGYGASFQGGAGMGGAIFIRTGNLDLSGVNFINNEARGITSSSPTIDDAKGLGGALFVLHTLSNLPSSNQGMPDSLPNVTACSITFSTNSASHDTQTSNNNNNYFDLANRINQGAVTPGILACDANDTNFSHTIFSTHSTSDKTQASNTNNSDRVNRTNSKVITSGPIVCIADDIIFSDGFDENF